VSNLIFPMPAPPQGSWAWPVKKTPSYKTLVQTPASNRGETRVSLTPNPIYMFEYDFSYLKGDFQTLNSAIANLMGFYQAVRGASDDWLFQDPYDKTLLTQLIGYGNGSTTQFQIGRALGFGAFEMMQNVFPSALYVNGVSVPAGPQASGNQWYCGLENLLQNSQDFELSGWSSGGSGGAATIIPDANVAPDGTSTADQLSYPSTTGGLLSDVFQTITGAVGGQTYTFSVWLQTASGTGSIQILAYDSVTGAGPAPLPCTVTSSWQRFQISCTLPASTSGQVRAIIRSFNQGAGVVRAWGAQLERWPSATSYVATANTAPVIPRGLATFTTAPAQGLPVTADFGYYYRCRFVEDEWTDLEEFLYQLWELKSFKFKSLIL
jgi:hypothetical protein